MGRGPTITISDLKTLAEVAPKTGATLLEGQVFHDRYVIERKLGAGAMGVVYAAVERTSGEPLAIKLINPQLADRPTARERFVREGVTARNIRHANVVGMYEVGEADGQVYLVMEYVRGETLRKWLRRMIQERCDVPFETARGIIREILQGLAAAHAAGVVHRDLKPENVMLLGDPQSGDFRLKILDFGIARDVGATAHLTTTSSSTGTPLYMAPEQKTAAETVGPPADLYAVTAMLYEILTEVAPDGRSGALSRQRKDLPAAIDEVVETGLASRPRSRYQTAAEYLQALDAIGRVTVEPKKPESPLQPPPPEPPPQPPPPPPPPGTSLWDGLVKRSRAQAPGSWALWDRLSTPQRVVFILVAVVVGGALIGYCQGPRPIDGYGGGVAADPPRPGPEGTGATTEVQRATNGSGARGLTGGAAVQGGAGPVVTPPTTPVPVAIAGRWSDEVTGTGVAVGYVDIGQQGRDVAGPIYNMQGYQVGTFEGRIDGRSMEYRYAYANGVAGTGRGALRADGIHLDVQARDHLAGASQRHTLHKYHWPPQ